MYLYNARLFHRIGGFFRGAAVRFPKNTRPRRLLIAFLALLFLPAVLSPTHPVAVYPYLATTHFPAMSHIVHAASPGGLETFLISPAQVERYRVELRADMADRNSGGLFAIVRDADGTLEHAPLRTWNSFLPDATPAPVRNWFDLKEFSFLGDQVELWLGGRRIVAMGHYHAFGGGPSAGDRLAQRHSDVPEIVVSNGIVPLVYLHGDLVPYGKDVELSDELFRSMRTLERSLMMGVDDSGTILVQPSPGLQSFLAYLRDYRGVAIHQKQEVAMEIYALCVAFGEEYEALFEKGFTQVPNTYEPDRASVVRNLNTLRCWTEVYDTRLPKSAA